MKTEKYKRIVWLRHDLRIYDNPALFRAAEEQEGVLAVYFICREMLTNHVVAPVQVDFTRRHLLQINSDLTELNIPLVVICVEKTEEITPHLQTLIKQYSVFMVDIPILIIALWSKNGIAIQRNLIKSYSTA